MGGGVGVGLGDQSGCERRIEVFVKIQKKKFSFGGGGGGGGSVGGRGGGQSGCERRIEVFVKIQKKNFFFWGGGGGGGGRGRVRVDVKNTCLLFFHEESIHEVSRRYLIPEYHRCKISGSKILKKGNNSKNII